MQLNATCQVHASQAQLAELTASPQVQSAPPCPPLHPLCMEMLVEESHMAGGHCRGPARNPAARPCAGTCKL